MKTVKRIPWLLPLILVVVFGIAVLAFRSFLSELPLSSGHTLFSPTAVFGTDSGRMFIIDNAKKSVLVINPNGELTVVINASDRGFFYASIVTEDESGNIYIADAKYSGQGTTLESERVFKYSNSGTAPEPVYEIIYPEPRDAPKQYGNIKELSVQSGVMTIAVQTSQHTAEMRKVDLSSGEVISAVEYDFQELYISDLALIDAELPVFSTKRGALGYFTVDGELKIADIDASSVTWNVAAYGDTIYFTDLSDNTLKVYDIASGAVETLITAESPLYSISVGLNGNAVYSTNQAAIFAGVNGETEIIDSFALSSNALRFAGWLSVLLAAASAVVLLIVIIVKASKHMNSDTFQQTLTIAAVSTAVSVLVSYMIISTMINREYSDTSEHLSYFCDVLVNIVDTDDLNQINSVNDYRSYRFNAVKDELDRLTSMTYDNGMYYYYIVYRTDGDTIYAVMDYEDTLISRQPMYPYGTEGYTEPFEGETVAVSSEISAYGAWSFVLKPVYDANGDVCAVMEVGKNLDEMQLEFRRLILGVAASVAAATVVLIMLIFEVVFYQVNHKEASKSGRREIPLRTLVFIAFMADCLQDSFVSVYARQLYVPIAGIPEEMGAALPLSAQVLFAALAAVLCGALIKRMGSKRALVFGFAAEAIGFAICAFIPTYIGLVLGKTIIGIGMGFIVVACNSVAAERAALYESAAAEAFSSVNSGTLAGVTVGAGISSVLLTLGSFSMVYIFGMVLLVLGFVLAFTVKISAQNSRTEDSETAEKVSILRFITDRQVITFLIFMLLPFMISISFREFFFPLYATSNGVSESSVGQIFLICGLFVIYIGPKLTEKLISKLGGKITAIIASAVVCAGVAAFAVVPSYVAAIIGIAVFTAATSFGYAAQSVYYTGRKSVLKYGEGKALGIYSLFENVGQTIGPIVYAGALTFGNQAGIALMGGIVAIPLLLFIILSLEKNRKSKGKII